ncbi:MAG TPA: DM13 domain-containing protein [Acidimicrobiales bacterium]|nr:DM13 domain-containing protein [Acidimicrobiales bacterium]
MSGWTRRRVALAVVLAVAGACGGSSAKGTASPTPSTAATTTSSVPHSAPRWETLTRLSGTGPLTTDKLTILPGALQWRARWSCQSGHLKVSTIPPPRRGEPMIDAECTGVTPTTADSPGSVGANAPVGYSIVTGAVQLKVEATGPWAMTVDQQVDTPLDEAPLPAMAAAPVLAQGDFYNIEYKGTGHATLYKLPDGSLALRLENFQVSNNTDLFLWVSEAAEPKSSADAANTPHVEVGNLKSTFGSENYVLPPSITPEKAKSIVVWCQPVRVAYTAAALRPA